MTLSWSDELAQRHLSLKESGLWRERRAVQTAQSSSIGLNDKSLLNFSSNDYLGLANNALVKTAAGDALSEWGVGSGASHSVCGHNQAHEQLELEIASFVGAERSVLFASGFMANLAIGSSFLSKGDLFLQDKLNHASLIDSGLASKSYFKRYAHNNLAHARQLINSTESNRIVIASDAIFSMDGDVAPLLGLHKLADESDALLFVDDAHGFGVLGECGKGSLNSVGLKPQANILMMGTFGKALGSYGAFIAGDSVFIEHIVQTARSYIYTTALPPSIACATSASIRHIKSCNGELQQRLRHNIAYFKERAKQLGIVLMPSETAIQPILIGDSKQANDVSKALLERGVLLTAIRPPTVPKGTARLRVALSASHSESQIDELLQALGVELSGFTCDLK